VSGPGRLAGRTALIVGGTGGIGLASARRFLREGARVVVAGLEEIRAEVLAELRALGPCAGWPCDAARADDVRRLFEETLEFLGGRLDVLFHVAGISGRRFGDGALHECESAGWDRVLENNARTVFLTNREAVRRMLGQSLDVTGLRGTIVNVGSVLARSPAPAYFDTVAYAASKGAVQALTIASAARYASERIRFNVLEPGLIATPMARRAVNDAEIGAYLTTKQALSAGPCTAEDVAEAALFLCEPASRSVTGTILTVDGGWSVSEGRPPEGIGVSE
jgi:NAD(P)-dependent dehydrogenase (short-subunit alcohol dehydrogenase family)